MYRMIRGLMIATPLLAFAACMADPGTSGNADEQEPQPASEAAAVVQAADTTVVPWTDVAVDPAEDADPDTCRRQVSNNDSTCPDGFVCLWQNINREGFGVRESVGCSIRNMMNVPCVIQGFPFPCSKGNGTFNDEMSSWQNNTSLDYCWFYDAVYRTHPVGMPAHTTHNQVTTDNNDKASSLRPASQGC